MTGNHRLYYIIIYIQPMPVSAIVFRAQFTRYCAPMGAKFRAKNCFPTGHRENMPLAT